MKARLITAAALLAALFLSGCAAVTIGRITADPSHYRNRRVQVTGTVTNSFGILGKGGYQIEDPTGKIYVLSTSGVPSKGTRVAVTGSVIEGATVLGKAYGTAIREDHHKVR
jgi:hypothetical protein